MDGSPQINIDFTSNGTYTWNKNSDGTWQSDVKKKTNATCTMISNEFTVSENRKLKFDWSVSSENVNYDYLYYTIKSLSGGKTIGGDSTQYKLGGQNYGSTYETLIFQPVEVELEPGTYQIEFTYKTDGSNNQGLDSGFVRNVRVEGSGIYVLTTDENGEITANLPEGLYKIIEVEAPEGYELPDDEEARTHYVGIGATREEKREIDIQWSNAISGNGFSNINDIKNTDDGGYIIAGSFYGESNLNRDDTDDVVTSKGGLDALVAKFDKDGKLEWHEEFGESHADEFNSVSITSDGGYIVAGYEYSDDYEDGILIKLGSSGETEWEKKIVGKYEDKILDATVLSNGNIVVVGRYYKSAIKFESGNESETGNEITNSGLYDGFIACYNPEGECQWSKGINGSNNIEASSVTETANGFVVSVNYLGSIKINDQFISSTGYQDSILIGYTKDGNWSWNKNIGSSSNESIVKLITDGEDNVIALGGFNGNITIDGQTINAPASGYSNAIMLKVSSVNGDYISNFNFPKVRSSADNKFTSAVATEDGGLMIGGWFYNSTIDIDGDGTNDITSNGGCNDGIIIKLTDEDEIEWYRTIKGTSYDTVFSVAELNDGGLEVVGNFDSTNLSSGNKTNILSSQGYNDSFMIKLGMMVTEAEIPALQEIEVENELKKFKITTEIGENSDKEREGGEITGEHTSKENINLVEEVKYGYDSEQEIVITPKENYSVYSITIDGEEYSFTPGDSGIVKIPIFNNVQQDHHIIVVFEKNLSSVLVHHYLKDRDKHYTDTPLAEDDYYTGKIGSKYVTSPKDDIKGYELEKLNDGSGKYNIPSDATGNYKDEQIVVTYYYEEVPLNLTVHHYLEGTQQPLVQDEEKEIYKDDNFTTTPNAELLKTYDLVEDLTEIRPEDDDTTIEPGGNISGTMKDNTEITYYYKFKEYEITTEVKLHDETDIGGNVESVKGGKISGENQNPYETVIINENSENDIIAEADEGYQIISLTIQSLDEEKNVIKEEKLNLEELIKNSPEEENQKYLKKYTFDKFTNVTSDKHVIVEFIKIQGKVIVHHYIKDTENHVPLQDGTPSEDEIKTGAVGDPWASKALENVSEKYELVQSPENSSGEFKEEDQEITYYYELKDSKVIVHHYKEGTTESLAEDEVITGKVDAPYTTNRSDEVPSYYELVEEPSNKNGTMTVEDTIVTYYYRIKKYAYKVYYKEKDTETELKLHKEECKEYDTEILSDDEIINIDGYNFDHYDKENIKIKENEEENVITIYYTKRNDLSYVVNYLEEGTEKVLHDQKAVTVVEFGTKIKSETEKIDITGYEFTRFDKDELEIGTDINENYINIYYKKKNFEYEIHYFYDGIEDTTQTERKEAEFESKIEEYPDKNNGYVFEKDENCPLIVGAEEDKNIINVYYRTQYKITTDVIEHTEKYKDGTTIDSVKGGTISGEDLEYYELVFKGDSNENKIEMKPDEGYEIVKVIINEIEIENLEITEDGILVLDAGYFSDVQEDQHIEVEFRKKSKVTVKYLEKDTETELSEPTEIPGYEGKDFTTDRKVITAYKAPEVGITDEEKKHIDPDGVMYADEIVIIYWYEKISSGIIERHIEINEKAEVSEIESSTIEGFVLDEKTIARKTYEGYIAVDGPQNENPDIIVAKKDDTEIKVVMQENKIIEVWYYYEKQYDITTEVKQHKEIKDGVEQLIDGGRISKEYEIDEQGNKNEIVYEKVLSRGDNKKIIEMVPDDGYRIKALCINDTQIDIKEMVKEDKSIVLAEKYFEDVQENKHVVVEFEKIPAKVIVKYQDIDTKEDIEENKEVEGYVNDPYSEERIEIEDYIPAGDEPENKSGNMVEEDTIVIFYYKKQFKITTDVKEHEESGADGNKYPVKGGSISGEDELPYEKVLRGENSTKNIDIKPESGYRPKKITINGEEIELKDTTRLALFENMQEDKHIVVEFERIPARVVIKYIDENSGNEVAEKEIIEGFVNDEYTSSSKDIEGYELVSEKLPCNASGKLAEDEIVVIYYYRKIEEVAQKPDFEQVEEPSNIIENAVVEEAEDNIRDVKTGDNIFNNIIVLITSAITAIISFIKKYKKNK